MRIIIFCVCNNRQFLFGQMLIYCIMSKPIHACMRVHNGRIRLEVSALLSTKIKAENDIHSSFCDIERVYFVIYTSSHACTMMHAYTMGIIRSEVYVIAAAKDIPSKGYNSL